MDELQTIELVSACNFRTFTNTSPLSSDPISYLEPSTTVLFVFEIQMF